MFSSPKDKRKTRRKRTYNVRLVRRDYSYDIREISELFSLHPQAVRRWQQTGLTSNDGSWPRLFHGSEVIRYLDERQKARKQKVPAGEVYCCGCRTSRRPAGARMELNFLTGTKINLVGTCPDCGSRLNRFGSIAQLENYRQHLVIRVAGQETLTGPSGPANKCQKEKENS